MLNFLCPATIVIKPLFMPVDVQYDLNKDLPLRQLSCKFPGVLAADLTLRRLILGKLGSVITRSPQFNRAACLIEQGSWERRPPGMKLSLATKWSRGDRPAYCAGEKSVVVDRFQARVQQLERGAVGSSN